MIKDSSCDINGNVFNRESCDMQKLKLLCITCPREDMSYQQQAELACLGGADMIQLRDKSLSPQALVKLSRELREICGSFKIAFTLNGDIEIAREAGCDGVYLEYDAGMPYSDARKILPYGVIGVSVHTAEEAATIEKDGELFPADYIGLSPVFTEHMEGEPKVLGLEGLRKAVSKFKNPVIAAGGININNVKEIMGTGVHGIAVARAVCGAEDIKGEAKKLKEAILKADINKK